MSDLKTFDEVPLGGRFIDLNSYQLCSKLLQEYVALSQVVFLLKKGDSETSIKEIHRYNAVVEYAGYLIHLQPKHEVKTIK